ncbi:hypothetical protein RN001_015471 [Aquatica leii]|uniref:AMP-binding enzyme C-terminal domain-containing protein n=1 Tax=Aquatica leii TaxID=1421715 RepID=A0AAN7PQV0_9COLE|nr:hypothetical protein RN001_015471 [Aquatica leii]
MKSGKAPDPNEITAEILRTVCRVIRDELLSCVNNVLEAVPSREIGRPEELEGRGLKTVDKSTIENVILSHPSVRQAIVIGIPHEIDGEHPMGVVVLKDKYKNVSEKEMEEFVKERVQDSHRLRTGVKILNQL